MKSFKQFNEELGFGNHKKISENYIELFRIVGKYEIESCGVANIIEEINNYSKEELVELYESLSSNAGSGYNNNTPEENLQLDLINYFKLV